ncbi:MAG: HTH-type transcriptional regulator Hpr [Bacillales bacterium]|nr:HTH-type transcriptional regulator Hpr [Bacillales bacterium]
MKKQEVSINDAMLFTQRVAQLSKALWKAVEKDWQQWIKPYNFNINEHHILCIAYHLKGASISDIAKFGVMHVSTAFNFSKKLEEQGYLKFSKKESDKRNTYVELTNEGEAILHDLMEKFNPETNSVVQAALPLNKLFGKFPDFLELSVIIKNLYGDDFMEIIETSLQNMEESFHKEDTFISTNEPTEKITS